MPLISRSFFAVHTHPFYSSSILEPESTLIPDRSTFQNGAIASTADRRPSYKQPHNNSIIWTARHSFMFVLSHYASGSGFPLSPE